MKNLYTKKWNDINEVKLANFELGHTYFSPDTMRYFQSKIETNILHDRYYIESETKSYGDKNSRVFIVNMVDDRGAVDHMSLKASGLREEFETLEKATEFLNWCVEYLTFK